MSLNTNENVTHAKVVTCGQHNLTRSYLTVRYLAYGPNFAQTPHTNIEPSRAEFRLEVHCFWQLNLTGGSRHDGKGLLSQKFLWTDAFPLQAYFIFYEGVTSHWRATHFVRTLQPPAGSHTFTYTWIQKPTGFIVISSPTWSNKPAIRQW